MRRRIGILFGPRSVTDTEILAGIRDYCDRHAPWDLVLFHSGWSTEMFIPELVRFEGDGLIVRPVPGDILRAIAAAFADRHQPLVLAGADPTTALPQATHDMVLAGRMAAEHLIDRGYRSLLHFHAGDREVSAQVREGVSEAAAAHGLPWATFESGMRTRAKGVWSLQDQLDDLADLLRARKQPIGVVTPDEAHGYRAIEAAARADCPIPQQCAIVTVGNDELFCVASRPTLSAVVPASERVGYEAARLMDQLLNQSADVAHGPILVPPTMVITRQSSDHTAVEDDLIIEAVRMIRAHLDEPLSASVLADRLNVSRSTLARRFAAVMQTTPAAEIRRIRVEHVKHLILTTRWSFARIAVEAGFGQVSNMNHTFKRQTGVTPSTYRAQAY